MALLRILLGSLTSTIVRLGLTAAILLLAYLLLVKPAFESAGEAVHDKSQRVLRCVEHAGGDVHRIQRCGRRF